MKHNNLTENSNGIYYSNIPKDFKLPRTFIIKNEEVNKEIYVSLLQQVGEIIRFESDEINGVFKVILDNGEIKLKEII